MSRFTSMFLWHLRRERTRMLLLAFAAALFVGLDLALSNSIRPAEVQEMLEKFPPAIRALIGLAEGEMFDLSRWVGLIHEHPIWLVATLAFPLASSLGGVAGGVDDGSLELVLAQPISRTTYYASLAAVVALGVTVVLAGSLTGGLIVRGLVDLPGDLPVSTLLALSASGWALAISVGGIALLTSVVGAGGGRPGSWALGGVVGMFFLRFLADMVSGLEWLRWASVFGYHDPGQVVSDGLALGSFFLLVGVGAACAGLGLLVFQRKQLTF